MGETQSHWGASAVDLADKSLPSLKARFLIDHIPQQGKVLEIGCGDGKMLRTIARARPGVELHGCDVRVPGTPPDAYTFHQMTTSIPTADNTFDVALIFDVLEHVPDPPHTLAEVARVLRPGGRFIAFVPVEGEKLSFYELYRRALGADVYVQTKEHIQSFTHEGLRQLMEQHFVITEMKYAYHVVGQMMDATFFAAVKAQALRQFWWKDNVYYNGQNSREQSAASRVMNGLLRVGNAVAWVESTALAEMRWGAAGALVDSVVKK